MFVTIDTVINHTIIGRMEALYAYCLRVAKDPSLIGNDYDFLLSNFNIEEHTLGILMVL